MLRLFLLSLLGFVPSGLLSAPAPDMFTGRITVVDGDSLRVCGHEVRIFGIDAHEGRQSCQTQVGKSWPCGAEATRALQTVSGRQAGCQLRDIDRYDRLVATCTVDGTDLGAWMVAQGWALAYSQYSTRYVALERQAAAAAIDMHAGRFNRPSDWRRAQRARAAQVDAAAPSGCAIKGNISRSGSRIYHMPGQEHYARTRISPSKGERWFCSEAEARSAGWRRAKR